MRSVVVRSLLVLLVLLALRGPVGADGFNNAPAAVTATLGAGSASIGVLGAGSVGTIIGSVGVQATSTVSNGANVLSTQVLNNTTAIVVKASPGNLYSVCYSNNSTANAYIKIYNATSATAGSGTPVQRILMPGQAVAAAAGAQSCIVPGIEIAYSTGITFIVTTGYADTDTTAPAATTYVVEMIYR